MLNTKQKYSYFPQHHSHFEKIILRIQQEIRFASQTSSCTAITRLLRGDRTSSHSVISEPTGSLFVWCPPFADPQVRSLNKAHVSISKSIEIEALKNGLINIKGLRSRFSEAAEKKRKRRWPNIKDSSLALQSFSQGSKCLLQQQKH